ncbi:small nuclear RNA activating protein complex-50kD subunit (SNAP50) (ISS) isoform 1 [Galdieria sulphuraria]|uniref:Small nuclear RNA activating protein complex-50kD subunit (SNAP50) (ISS) isoform 1 n=1 Tax=Galdieria sulphuraria TaxID=130081 RepID=M2XKA5_GALSU|nr:small nuclear RNA activating protein complex-50kD subunit (SNAP50) (ISS) isoform 1 [Galdieria sulphuraria]EME30572.1 small nuclear RNA activating protein complex-50kD subunit (SNAP50) (ISS) isoform 1 [Galdieria sulphuraria]|eukprot:XP_005707092.1 small nuclear RNA activating protein complex-50kD subunit (SNAP50) (ISS) isoform 1 [Galdieria sulphuraria]
MMMDWNLELKDFDRMVIEASSEIWNILLELPEEDSSSRKESESSPESYCQTPVSNTERVPLNCEVLSTIEGSGICSLYNFSSSQMETEQLLPESWFGLNVSLSKDRVGVFQSYCRIGVFNEKLQLQQEILCSLNSTLEELYMEIFCRNSTIATKLLQDFSRNFLFCFENFFYTKLETWGSNEYVRNFEDFIKREDLERHFGKEFLRGLFLCGFVNLLTNVIEMVVKDAQGVQLGNLSIRFGVPYALLHLGDCEHKLIFQDLFADICEESQKVCKTVFLKPPKPRMCGACRVKSSVVVCHNHQLADASPYFLCCDCYERVKCDAETSSTYQLHSEHPSFFEN